MGAVLLLRDAHHPRLLPLLLGHRRRSRAAEDHRDGHRRRLRRPGVPVHRARRLDRRPAARHGAHGVLRRRGGHVRPHRARDPAGSGRRRRRPGACRAGLRRAEGQRVVAARHPVREGRCPLRRRLHAVLSRHQPRRLRRPADHRPAADPRRLPLRLRCRRRRHGTGPHPVCRLPAEPRQARPHCAEPVAAQRYRLGCRDRCGRRRRHRGGVRDRAGQAGEPVAGDDGRHHRRRRSATSR